MVSLSSQMSRSRTRSPGEGPGGPGGGPGEMFPPLGALPGDEGGLGDLSSGDGAQSFLEGLSDYSRPEGADELTEPAAEPPPQTQTQRYTSG